MKLRPFENVLAALSLACALVVGLDRLGVLPWRPLAGSVFLGLYPLYSLAAAAGWLLGNLYVRRSVGGTGGRRWLLFAFYAVAPVGPLFLLRAMAPIEQQMAAPLVPWLCAAIVVVFFLVPVSLRPRQRGLQPRFGKRDREGDNPNERHR